MGDGVDDLDIHNNNIQIQTYTVAIAEGTYGIKL